jgi:hypothetical protein
LLSLFAANRLASLIGAAEAAESAAERGSPDLWWKGWASDARNATRSACASSTTAFNPQGDGRIEFRAANMKSGP